jgi:hypothetical protein
MKIAARLKRLERSRGAGPCDGRPLSVVLNDHPVPAGAPRCARCGVCHLLRVRLSGRGAPPGTGAIGVSILARLKRLERSHGGRSCGAGCPPLRYIGDGDWYDQKPQSPASCPRRGRQASVIPIVYDPDFYGNADRLAALRHGK